MDLLKAASRFTEYALQHAPKTHEKVLKEVGDALENSGYSPMVSTFHESINPTGKDPSFEAILDPEYSDIHGGEVSDQTLVDILGGTPAEKAKTIEGLYDVLENIKADKGLSPATRKMLETFLEKRHAQKPVEEFKPTVLRGRLPPREQLETAATDMFERAFGWAKLAKEDPKAKVRNKPNCVFDNKNPKVKDNKDHFPLGNINQARNALARCKQYKTVPEWYSGSLKSLQEAVAKKVKKEYPSIDVSEKKGK